MDTITTILAGMIACLIIGTPTVIVGEWIYDKIQEHKASK